MDIAHLVAKLRAKGVRLGLVDGDLDVAGEGRDWETLRTVAINKGAIREYLRRERERRIVEIEREAEEHELNGNRLEFQRRRWRDRRFS